MRDYDRHVVLAPRIDDKIDQCATLFVRRAVRAQRIRDLRVIGHVGQPVRAEEHDVAVQEAAALDVDPRDPRADPPEGLGQDALHIARLAATSTIAAAAGG